MDLCFPSVAAPVARNHDTRPTHRWRILVVDDDPDFCTVIGELLRLFAMEVHKAHCVDEALTLLGRLTPDLILTDVMMPGTDGLELIRRLRAEPTWRSIPTLVVSARVQKDEQMAAMLAGADAFLPKPFSLRELRAAIATYLH
jgi:CheY-like chemotaxis protein